MRERGLRVCLTVAASLCSVPTVLLISWPQWVEAPRGLVMLAGFLNLISLGAVALIAIAGDIRRRDAD